MANVYSSFTLLVIFLALSLSETQDLNILVMDSKTKEENPVYLFRYVDDSLKLICELRDNIDDEIKLKWILPDQNRSLGSYEELKMPCVVFSDSSFYVQRICSRWKGHSFSEKNQGVRIFFLPTVQMRKTLEKTGKIAAIHNFNFVRNCKIDYCLDASVTVNDVLNCKLPKYICLLLGNYKKEDVLILLTSSPRISFITFDNDDEIISNETSFDPTQSDDRRNESLKLYVSHLKVTDSGSYTCEAFGNTTGSFNHTIKLFVKLRKDSCGKMFECEDNKCIAGIYKCDGFPDCKSKNDEAPEICGENPCEGRIRCSTGRCIPKEWCNACDPLKVNCTNRLHKHDCCHQVSPYPADIMGYGDGSHYHRFDMSDSPNMEHHYDLKFIQTTIYTIIGCAIVFMIIVSVLVIAICRVHMKRSLPSNLPNNRRAFVTTAYRRACTQDLDLDISLNRVDVPGLLVTYNINNGVQIVGSPVEPPPYSEIASLPPREGPPPPYTLSQLYESPPNVHNVRLLSDGTSVKPGRHGLSHSRVSSEPSLLNVNRL